MGDGGRDDALLLDHVGAGRAETSGTSRPFGQDHARQRAGGLGTGDDAALAQPGGDQPRDARFAARAVDVDADADAVERSLVEGIFDDRRGDQQHGDDDQ